jgi:hypothetical protein
MDPAKLAAIIEVLRLAEARLLQAAAQLQDELEHSPGAALAVAVNEALGTIRELIADWNALSARAEDYPHGDLR